MINKLEKGQAYEVEAKKIKKSVSLLMLLMSLSLMIQIGIVSCGLEGYKLNTKEEKRLPNGTVVGNYAFSDVKGNPIIVKYFANEFGYGIEMKSVKEEVKTKTHGHAITEANNNIEQQDENNTKLIPMFRFI